ncbi:MAG: nicotinate-nucleotide adenylyltransferase [Verrucomicrobiales bacterium]|jgi:nicotinate-nucleotide adenylyltransferase
MKRVALFGGSFDPIHRGHAFIAERAVERCALDEVLFVPCWQSPHKAGVQMASGDDRSAMVRLATQAFPWATVSDWELDRKEPSYSWQTAEHWRSMLDEDDELFWILGMDQWSALSRWARVDYLARLVTFIVFPRDGEVPEEVEGRRAAFLPDAMAVSATEIRTRTAAGGSIEEDVGAEVAAYVKEKRLYRSV